MHRTVKFLTTEFQLRSVFSLRIETQGSTEEEHVKLICEEMLPAIEKAKAAGQLKNLENIDAFCEKNVINVENTSVPTRCLQLIFRKSATYNSTYSRKKILEAGKKLGLAANFHAEELSCIGGAEMGASVGARAMSHLEEISDNGIKAMAASGTTAVLLPSTAFILRLTPPPARKMIESGQ